MRLRLIRHERRLDIFQPQELIAFADHDGVNVRHVFIVAEDGRDDSGILNIDRDLRSERIDLSGIADYGEFGAVFQPDRALGREIQAAPFRHRLAAVLYDDAVVGLVFVQPGRVIPHADDREIRPRPVDHQRRTAAVHGEIDIAADDERLFKGEAGGAVVAVARRIAAPDGQRTRDHMFPRDVLECVGDNTVDGIDGGIRQSGLEFLRRRHLRAVIPVGKARAGKVI